MPSAEPALGDGEYLVDGCRYEFGEIVHGPRLRLERFGAGRTIGGLRYRLAPAGEKVLGELKIDVEAARASRRHFARLCIDFTERRPHLAGALGAAVCGRLMELRWLVRRVPGERALRLTDAGRTGLAETFGI